MPVEFNSEVLEKEPVEIPGLNHVAVVIDYSGDAESLLVLLQQLRKQTYSDLPFEIPTFILYSGDMTLPPLSGFQVSAVHVSDPLPQDALYNVALDLLVKQGYEYALYVHSSVRLPDKCFLEHMLWVHKISTLPGSPIGMLAPLLRYTDNRIYSAGGYLNSSLDRKLLFEDSVMEHTQFHASTCYGVEFVPLECVLLDLSIFGQVKWYSGVNPPVYLDVETGYRLRAAGGRVAVTPQAFAVCTGEEILRHDIPPREVPRLSMMAKAQFAHSNEVPVVSLRSTPKVRVCVGYVGGVLDSHILSALHILEDICGREGYDLSISSLSTSVREEICPSWSLKRSCGVCSFSHVDIVLGSSVQPRLSLGKAPQILWELSPNAFKENIINGGTPFDEIWFSSVYGERVLKTQFGESIVTAGMPLLRDGGYAPDISPIYNPRNFPFTEQANFLYLHEYAPLEDLSEVIRTYAQTFPPESRCTLTVCSSTLMFSLGKRGMNWEEYLSTLGLPRQRPAMFLVVDQEILKREHRPHLISSFDFIIGGVSVHDHLSTSCWEAGLLGKASVSLGVSSPMFLQTMGLAVNVEQAQALVGSFEIPFNKRLVVHSCMNTEHFSTLMLHLASLKQGGAVDPTICDSIREASWAELLQYRESLCHRLRELISS